MIDTSVQIAFYLFLSWVLITLERKTAKDNYGSWCNGLGAIPVALDATGRARGLSSDMMKAPMVYRVLVPWIVAIIEKIVNHPDDDRFDIDRLRIYLWVKQALMFSAMIAADYFFGPAVALVMALFWVATFQFDYWDIYGEALGFVLVLGGATLMVEVPWMGVVVAVGVAILVMSRETVWLVPLMVGGLWLVNGWQMALGAFVVQVVIIGLFQLLLRKLQGKWPRYWHRIVIGQNLDYKETWAVPERRYYLILGWLSILFSVFCLIHPDMLPEPFRATFFMPAVIAMVGFVGGFVHEPRIFALISLWMGAMMTGR
jgi:hypothetical protein